jgi:hypothetical protein
MLAALESGVKGGRWYSLMDKVMAAATLRAAWQRVQANRGSAGVDRISVQRFAFNLKTVVTLVPRASVAVLASQKC